MVHDKGVVAIIFLTECATLGDLAIWKIPTNLYTERPQNKVSLNRQFKVHSQQHSSYPNAVVIVVLS